jgi:hypothetical protein
MQYVPALPEDELQLTRRHLRYYQELMSTWLMQYVLALPEEELQLTRRHLRHHR